MKIGVSQRCPFDSNKSQTFVGTVQPEKGDKRYEDVLQGAADA